MKDLLLFTLIRLQVVSFELCIVIDVYCTLYNTYLLEDIKRFAAHFCAFSRPGGERFWGDKFETSSARMFAHAHCPQCHRGPLLAAYRTLKAVFQHDGTACRLSLGYSTFVWLHRWTNNP